VGRDVKRMIMMCEVKGHGISTWRVYICTSEVLVWTGIEKFSVSVAGFQFELDSNFT
jgi:hypothetical protein